MEFSRKNLTSLKFTKENIALNLPQSNKASQCVINMTARARAYIKLPIGRLFRSDRGRNRCLFRRKSSETYKWPYKGFRYKHDSKRYSNNFSADKTSGVQDPEKSGIK